MSTLTIPLLCFFLPTRVAVILESATHAARAADATAQVQAASDALHAEQMATELLQLSATLAAAHAQAQVAAELAAQAAAQAAAELAALAAALAASILAAAVSAAAHNEALDKLEWERVADSLAAVRDWASHVSRYIPIAQSDLQSLRQHLFSYIDLRGLTFGDKLVESASGSVYSCTCGTDLPGELAVKVELLSCAADVDAFVQRAFMKLELHMLQPKDTLGVKRVAIGPGTAPGNKLGYMFMPLAEGTLSSSLLEFKKQVRMPDA